MLMKDKNRNAASVIISKMQNRPQPLKDAPQSAGAEVADADEMYCCAEEVMKALETRDIRAFKDALQAMIEVTMNKQEAQEDAMESESESEMG